jgi:hypothetical protein
MCFPFGCWFPVCRKSWRTVAKPKAQKLKILQPKMLTMSMCHVDTDVLNVSFSEMELGKNMNVYLRRHANYMQIYRQI